MPSCRTWPSRRDPSRRWRYAAAWPFSTSDCRELLGCLFDRGRQWLGAGPAMLGDIEEHVLGAVELLLEIAGLLPAVALVDVVLGAEAFELLRKLLDVLDQHPEMVDAAKIHTLSELVALEFEDRHVERAVAQEHAIGENAIRPAHLHEIEGLLIEFGHRVGIFGGDGDMAQLGHRRPPRVGIRANLARSPGQFEASCRTFSASSASSRAKFFPTWVNASSQTNSPNRSNSGSMVPFGSAKCELQVKLFGSGNCRGFHANSARSLPRR